MRRQILLCDEDRWRAIIQDGACMPDREQSQRAHAQGLLNETWPLTPDILGNNALTFGSDNYAITLTNLDGRQMAGAKLKSTITRMKGTCLK